MSVAEVEVRDEMVSFKRTTAPNRRLLKRAYADVKDHVRRAADHILKSVAAADVTDLGRAQVGF